MSNSPQDVYARNLLSHRGYPLWSPEPYIELPDSYQREGLKIGDVGFVVPADGSFDVFFNITLPREHPLHAHDGVPNNFTQVELTRDDYRIAPDAEGPGRVIASRHVKCTTSCFNPFDPVDSRAYSLTNHQFILGRKEAAILILPEGAQRHRLAKELLLLDVIIQNAVEWYRFAREQLRRDVGSDALYLVTGFHKASSWSLASIENAEISTARCGLVRSTNVGPILPDLSTWSPAPPLECRIGPRMPVGFPNQSVFITGFRIAIRGELLHLKRVIVTVDHSERTLASRFVGFGANLVNILMGWTSGEKGSSECSTRGNRSTAEDRHPDAHENVTVERVPQVSQPFHPSDIINHYLLRTNPSASIAVVHDSQWIALLKTGILTREELAQEIRMVAALSREYRVITKDGAVYLQSIRSATAPRHRDTSAKQPQPRIAPSPAPFFVQRDRGTNREASTPNHTTLHVALVGHTGVGKSTLVNVLLGKQLAEVNNNVGPCTTGTMPYELVERGTRLCIWDTRGLNEGTENTALITRMLRVARILPDTEGELKTFLRGKHPRVNLVLLCVDAKKMRIGVHWKLYNKIYEDFCEKGLKVAVVVMQIEGRDLEGTKWKQRCRRAAAGVVKEFPEESLIEAVPKFEKLDYSSVWVCRGRILKLISDACRM